MALLQLLGFSAFILASLVLGTRLLLLWRQTREVPELVMGSSFLTGGGLGYSAWFLLALLRQGGASVEDTHWVGVAGLALTCTGALTIAKGAQLVFCPEHGPSRWLVAGFGLSMAAGLTGYAVLPQEERFYLFWLALLTAGASYSWVTAECFQLHRLLQKRSRFGLASPLLVDRARLWGLAFASVVAMIAVGYVNYLVHCSSDPGPAWVSTLQSSFGLLCAGSIWLGFFPPAFYRRRFSGSASVPA